MDRDHERFERAFAIPYNVALGLTFETVAPGEVVSRLPARRDDRARPRATVTARFLMERAS